MRQTFTPLVHLLTAGTAVSIDAEWRVIARRDEDSEFLQKGKSIHFARFFGGQSPLSPNPAGELLQEVSWLSRQIYFLEAEIPGQSGKRVH